MAKITYNDKSFLNQNVSIADENKVNDTDLNEIKNVVNTNDDNYTGLAGDILWTNSNPNTSFPAGTVPSSGLNNCDSIDVFCKNYASSSYINVTSVRIPKGYNGYLTIVEVDGAVVNRQVIVNWNSNSITFNDAKFKPATSTAVASNDNNRAIPICVVGYKTNLFS